MKLGTNILSCEWELPKMFSRSAVKGQGHSEMTSNFPVEGYRSTYGRPSVVRVAEAY